MTHWLRRQGHDVAFCTVDRLMRDLGMNGVRRGKQLRTTIPAKDGHRAGDLLDRDFTAPAPNRRWVADFTYCRTWAGFVYVAFVVDVFAQRIVGWHAASDKRTDLVLTPLRIAMWDRDRNGHPVEPGACSAHSDAGSQYTSLRFTEHLELEGIAPSIGTVGDAYDNALMESIIGLFKTEASPRPSSTTAPTRPSPTSSTSPPAGSTGTTTDACTARSECTPRSSTSRTTTLPSAESRNPYKSGREPVTVHEGNTTSPTRGDEPTDPTPHQPLGWWGHSHVQAPSPGRRAGGFEAQA